MFTVRCEKSNRSDFYCYDFVSIDWGEDSTSPPCIVGYGHGKQSEKPVRHYVSNLNAHNSAAFIMDSNGNTVQVIRPEQR